MLSVQDIGGHVDLVSQYRSSRHGYN